MYGKRRTFKKNFRKAGRSRKYRKGYFRKSKRARISRVIGRKRRIMKMINSVAEKKDVDVLIDWNLRQGVNLMPTNNTLTYKGLLQQFVDYVVNGPLQDEMIGRQVFIRYIVVKGYFLNEQTFVNTQNSEMGQANMWIVKINDLVQYATPTLQQVMTSNPNLNFWDLQHKDIVLLKKRTWFMKPRYWNQAGADTNGNMHKFQFRIPVFKNLTFQSGTTSPWMIGNKKMDYYALPWVSQYNNQRNGNGVFVVANALFTYTDV